MRCVAEKLELDQASVDLVSVGNAIHLFNAQEFSSEAARVLKEDGVLLVARNGRTPSDLNLSIDRLFEEMGAENSNWRQGLSETWSLPEPMLKWSTQFYRSENWTRSMSVEEYLRLELSRPHASQAARRAPAVDLHTQIRKIVERTIKTESVEVEYVCQAYAFTKKAVAIT